MVPIAGIVFLLFFPASIGLLRQAIWGTELAHQLLTFGIFLFSIEQARMANQDLQQIAIAKKHVNDVRLNSFLQVTSSTIFLELLGFYLSSFDPGWGSIVILLSQVWFNLLAGVRIQSQPEVMVIRWNISERLPVLFADFLGLGLVSVWMLDIADLWISLGLVGMLMIYLSAKLVLFGKNYIFSRHTVRDF